MNANLSALTGIYADKVATRIVPGCLLVFGERQSHERTRLNTSVVSASVLRLTIGHGLCSLLFKATGLMAGQQTVFRM